MNTSTSKFDDFLDRNIVPMSWQKMLLICVIIVALISLAFYFLFFKDKYEEKKRREASIEKLENELVEIKRQAARLDEVKAEVARTEKEFTELSVFLPQEKEIPQLLTDISALGSAAGLDFMVFQPEPTRRKDFYDELPIRIKVAGPYHNVGSFFDQVSKLERIVTVDNAKMGSPKREGEEMILVSDCTLLTYQYSNKPLTPANQNNKNK